MLGLVLVYFTLKMYYIFIIFFIYFSNNKPSAPIEESQMSNRKPVLNTSEYQSSWIEPAAAAEIWLDFEHGRTNWARPWALYILDEWIRKNL